MFDHWENETNVINGLTNLHGINNVPAHVLICIKPQKPLAKK